MVTGASGGIGGAVVTALASAGHDVIAVGRDPGRLPLVPGVHAMVADLAQPQRLAAVIEEPGQLDALVHCAGVSVAAIAPVAATAAAVWQETMAVNVIAAAELTRIMLAALRRSRGHVVFVNSARGVRAAPNWSAFAASKAALQELADSLRAEEAKNGVRVTSLYPGATATEHLREVRAAFGSDYDPQRCISPQTLAAMVAWVLAAPADGYVAEMSVVPASRRG
ncbi:MAG: SDR family oxidoreductase [Planctomycetes bacterium]|nr:SDR family oxidoreductase [Planctomycetota bacterium]